MAKILITFLISGFSIFGTSYYKDDYLHVYFLDVGQGDSILFITPDDKVVLIDTGKDYKASQKLQELIPLSVNTIDLLIITHPDKDHSGGVDEISGIFHINKTIESGSVLEDQFVGCCVWLDFVWPDPNVENPAKADDTNANSIAMYVTYGEFDGFFGGDLPVKQEDLIAANSPKDVDLLKVSHHGSKSSTSGAFLDAILPELAVISVGANNQYRHPNAEVMDRLNSRKIHIMRTDESGTLELISDGKTYWVAP